MSKVVMVWRPSWDSQIWRSCLALDGRNTTFCRGPIYHYYRIGVDLGVPNCIRCREVAVYIGLDLPMLEPDPLLSNRLNKITGSMIGIQVDPVGATPGAIRARGMEGALDLTTEQMGLFHNLWMDPRKLRDPRPRSQYRIPHEFDLSKITPKNESHKNAFPEEYKRTGTRSLFQTKDIKRKNPTPRGDWKYFTPENQRSVSANRRSAGRQFLSQWIHRNKK